MASITKIGERWRAQVRRRGHPSKARTFDTRKEAETWARRVEAGIDAASPVAADDLTVKELILEYRRTRLELGRPILPETNTHYMLAHLAEDLGPESVRSLTPQKLVKWARMRHDQGAGGYTVNMELSALGTAIRHTASFLNITLPDVVGAARPLLHYGQLIGGGTRRTRNPTDDELAALIGWLTENRTAVVVDAVRVASITAMRRGEICRIAWDDLDDKRKAVLVRKRKHPRATEARDEWVPLLGDSWAIVQRQDRSYPTIFPISPETLTDSVTAAVKALSIPDLRLHDLRRHATTRLRELGFDADARKAITGHRSDEIHSRYVAVTVEELHARFDAAQDKLQRPQRPRRAPARQRGAKQTPHAPADSESSPG